MCYGTGAVSATLSGCNHGNKVYDILEEVVVPEEAAYNLRVYSKFYEPCYGDTMGPRVLVVFALDTEILMESLSLFSQGKLESINPRAKKEESIASERLTASGSTTFIDTISRDY